MPPDCALGTCAGLVLTLRGGALITLAFTLGGISGVANTTAFLGVSAKGVDGTFKGIASGCGLAGSFSFVATGFRVRRGFLTVGGPPDLITRGGFGTTFATGKGGAVSDTGVLGI